MTNEAVRFWKMSGAGNDFIVLPRGPETLGEDPAVFVRRVCRRGVSVGADGVLFVTRAASGGSDRARSMSSGPQPSPDAVLVHYNADGGRSEFCGNGSRCAARFAVVMGFASWPVSLRTDCGVLRAETTSAGVRLEVPPPTALVSRTLTVDGTEHTGFFLTAGVPHFVVRVADPRAVDVAKLGAALRSHAALGPAGANVDFVGPDQDVHRSGRLTAGDERIREDRTSPGGRWRVRTFERGVEAETLACGSGAIAVAAVLAREGEPSPVVMTPSSGIDLRVDFEIGPEGARAFHLEGEARIVYEGVLTDEAVPS